jgi:CheY-like chemotaxis protein
MANNGEECLSLLTDDPADSEFDIILMDCQMPGTQLHSPAPSSCDSFVFDRSSRSLIASWCAVMDGFEATQRIRRMGIARHGKAVPIVALTASATKDYAQRCFDVGMSDVLFKPLRREDLVTTLRKWTASPTTTDPPPSSPLPSPSTAPQQRQRSQSRPARLELA